MKQIPIRLLCVALALPLAPLWAHAATAATDKPAPAAGATVEMSEGEIRKVDKEAGKLTIRHGELKNLSMPPMTMVFRAQEPAMLDAVQVGDKVQFVADRIGGQFTVTRIEVNK